MARRIDERQERFLKALAEGKRTVDQIFLEDGIPQELLAKWLRSTTFRRRADAIREAADFKLDQELCNAAMVAGERLRAAAFGGSDFVPKPAQITAWINTIKLADTLVRKPRAKRELAEAKERAELRRAEAGAPLGYHKRHTPEEAAAVLRRIQRRIRRDEKRDLDRDQDENGKWMAAD